MSATQVATVYAIVTIGNRGFTTKESKRKSRPASSSLLHGNAATFSTAGPAATASERGSGSHAGVTGVGVEHQQVPAGIAAGRALLLVVDGHLVADGERRASRGQRGASRPPFPRGLRPAR